MIIRNQLLLAPLLMLLVGASAVAIVWHLNSRVALNRDIVAALDDQTVYLERLLRGINESILTNGTPESISVAQDAIRHFDRSLDKLQGLTADLAPYSDSLTRIEVLWQTLLDGVGVFLEVNNVYPSDEELSGYGRLLDFAEDFSQTITSLAEQGHVEGEALGRRASDAIIGVGLGATLILMAMLLHLYRTIARPIDHLARSMRRVSESESDLTEQLADSIDLSAAAGNDPNELAALTQAFTSMARRIDTQLRERNRVERQLNALNRELERRVEERTVELKDTLKALQDSEQRFRGLYENAPLAYQSLDEKGHILEVNDAWLSLLGYDRSEVIGRSFRDFRIVAADSARCDVDGSPTGEQEHWHNELDLRLRTGETITVSIDGRLDHDHTSHTTRTHCILTDVTDQRRAEAELRLAAAVVESTTEGVMITDSETRIVSVNHALTEITGYPKEQLIGVTPKILSSDRHDRAFYQSMWQTLKATDRWQGEIWSRRRSGESFPAWLTVNTLRDQAGKVSHYIGVATDISTLKQSEERLIHLAHHDVLTGLPNRLLISDRIGHALQRAVRREAQVAVLFLDLDHFKHLNDSLGHAVGDQLLHEAAQRVASSLRQSDSVGRIGGDEFIVVLEEVRELSDVAAIADKIVRAFDAPFHLGPHQLHTTTSIGISLFPSDGVDADTLIKNADAAMYRAKERGRNTFHFYTPDLTRKALERVELEDELYEALIQKQLVVFYQPQVDLESGKLFGAEALARWRHPERGLIMPDAFIPLAREAGLIREIDEWALTEACRQWQAWLDAGLSLGRVSVNLSAKEIDRDDMISSIAGVLQSSGLDGANLALEVTEGLTVKETAQTIEVLEGLRGLGIRVTIDNFGTGHLSLSRLKELPIDALKIDKSFVIGVTDDPSDQAIVQAIVSLSRGLELGVIAEGVETVWERDFLLAQGCRLGQGYLFSKPLGAEDFEHFVRSA